MYDLMKSDTIATIASALVKAQQAMKPAVKDADNPFFKSKYADLSAVWDAVREPLQSNGIAVIQAPVDDGSGDVLINTVLVHTSGEWIGSRLRMKPVKADPQGIGSCITYARRYALGAMTGLVTEDDDDGNAASHGRMTALEVAEFNTQKEASRRDVPSTSAGPPPASSDASYPFGVHKGKKLSDPSVSVSSLNWLEHSLTTSIADASKAKFKAHNEKLLNAVIDELARRSDEQVTEPYQGIPDQSS